MFKAVGTALVLISLGSFLYNKVEIKRKKFKNFCEIKKALTYLKHELKFCAPELFLICGKISAQTTGEISEIFAQVKNNLEKNSSSDFCTAWEEAAGKRELFSDNVSQNVKELIKSLGKKSLDIELENIEKAQNALDMLEAEEKDNYLKDRKLIYTLGAAACTIILILTI